jgi:Flp pilus assembly protein TadB
MWMDEAGRNMLYLALGFQMAGGFVLWRMIKSI